MFATCVITNGSEAIESTVIPVDTTGLRLHPQGAPEAGSTPTRNNKVIVVSGYGSYSVSRHGDGTGDDVTLLLYVRPRGRETRVEPRRRRRRCLRHRHLEVGVCGESKNVLLSNSCWRPVTATSSVSTFKQMKLNLISDINNTTHLEPKHLSYMKIQTNCYLLLLLLLFVVYCVCLFTLQ